LKEEDLIKEFMIDRVVFMDGEFNETKCQLLTKQLLHLNKKDQEKDIIIYIDSYGGEVYSLLQIYNLIKSFKCKVHTIATGKAMSAGSSLLMVGTKGKRFAYEHTRIMLHELSLGIGYDMLHDVNARVKNSNELMKILCNITKKHTKIKNVETFLKENKYISSKEALKLGIIDKIID